MYLTTDAKSFDEEPSLRAGVSTASYKFLRSVTFFGDSGKGDYRVFLGSIVR